MVYERASKETEKLIKIALKWAQLNVWSCLQSDSGVRTILVARLRVLKGGNHSQPLIGKDFYGPGSLAVYLHRVDEERSWTALSTSCSYFKPQTSSDIADRNWISTEYSTFKWSAVSRESESVRHLGGGTSLFGSNNHLILVMKIGRDHFFSYVCIHWQGNFEA